MRTKMRLSVCTCYEVLKGALMQKLALQLEVSRCGEHCKDVTRGCQGTSTLG